MHVALTGGASGIGAEVVKKLKAAGHTVTAFDISEPSGVDRWIQVDMSDPASVAAAVEAADGPFDALLNNAGLPPRKGLEEVILRVNFIGFRQFCEGMLGKLKPGAAIVNTASRAGAMWRNNIDQVKALMALDSDSDVAGFIAEHDMDDVRAYNLSKEAVIVYTMAETEGLIARDLRMNSVSPAAVATGILDDFVSAFGEKVAKNIQRVGRPGKPEEAADVILYLASPESGWLKGIDVVIDGGMGALAQTDMLGLK